jgi:response regulator RpfG family c-di-GMP phosphodiesterase
LHCLAFRVILCFCDETLINLDFSGENKMTAKTVNYTPEQTAKMVADYQAGTTVESIAEALGKSVRSVVAKLSREKVYIAKTYTTKTGEAVVKKDEFADYIAQALGLTEADADSLTKANKTALAKIAEFIKAEKA